MHISFFGFELCSSLCSCSNALLKCKFKEVYQLNKNPVHYFHDYISLVEAVLQKQSNLIALAHVLATFSACLQLLRGGLFW